MADSAWISVLVPIGVGASFALFRRLLPARPDPSDGPPLTAEERRIYHRWEMGALVPFFLFATSIGAAWYFVLKGAADFCWRTPPGTRFLVRLPDLSWGLPAIVLGIVSAAIPMHWLYAALLGDRYPRYERACNERVGFDGWRVFVWMAGFAVAGSGAFFWADVVTFARFDDQGVEIGHPLAVPSHFYPYARVRAIEHRASFVAPNGNVIPRDYYVIRFDDDATWSTGSLFHDDTGQRDDGAIARLVADRTRLPIVEIP